MEACNLYNYDETSVTDDPGRKRCITSTQQGTEASGTQNAPLEAGHKHHVLWKRSRRVSGTHGCLQSSQPVCRVDKRLTPGTVYSNSTSGWFDNNLFNKWFFELFLSYVKDKPGKKVFLGDNLASHFSIPVLEACKEQNILFISLVPNSTVHTSSASWRTGESRLGPRPAFRSQSSHHCCENCGQVCKEI